MLAVDVLERQISELARYARRMTRTYDMCSSERQRFADGVTFLFGLTVLVLSKLKN